jgi:hypothetical protein
MLAVKRGLYVVAAVAGVSLVISAARALRASPMPYRFEGYEYTGATRLAVLSITNLGSRSVEFSGPAEVHFADGWNPSWGNRVVVCSRPTIGGRKSGRWVFEVPPHGAKWKATCQLEKHTLMEKVASRLCQYRMLSWTWRYVRPQTTTFASDWVSE